MALIDSAEDLLDDIGDCYTVDEQLSVIQGYFLMWFREGKEVAYEEMED